MHVIEVLDKNGEKIALLEEGDNNFWYVYRISDRKAYGENWSKEQAIAYIYENINPKATFKNELPITTKVC